MRLRINSKSGKPVYRQVVDQVKVAVASGRLHAGEALPGIRPLAESLSVNRNTIAKAYAELENQGVIDITAGKGCVVRSGDAPYRKDVLEMLRQEIDAAVVQAHHLQVGRADFLRLAEARFDAFGEQRDGVAQD